jgi:23S rRNA pseudouridine1911/1915/1917 synthase
MRYEIEVSSASGGKTVGEILRAEGFSHRLITSLKRVDGGITVRGGLAKTVDICREGDIIVLRREDEKLPEPNYELEAAVLFENERVIVFDKPSGMPVHESARHRGDTLANVFAARCGGLSFRSVNRLDRDACGCVICAKDAHSAMILQKSYQKRYVAVCRGIFAEKSGSVNAPIARERESIITRCVRADGQPAVTDYRVLEEFGDKFSFFSLVEFNLHTGRTHQIRVHMSHIGHPIAGDGLYGGECAEYPTLCLCCAEAEFELPGGERVKCRSALGDFGSVILG